MNDRSNGKATNEPVFDAGVAGIGCYAALNPGVAGHCLGSRKSKILHESSSFRVFTKVGMQEAMASAVLVTCTRRSTHAQADFCLITLEPVRPHFVVWSRWFVQRRRWESPKRRVQDPRGSGGFAACESARMPPVSFLLLHLACSVHVDVPSVKPPEAHCWQLSDSMGSEDCGRSLCVLYDSLRGRTILPCGHSESLMRFRPGT